MHPTDEQIEALTRFLTGNGRYGNRASKSWKMRLRILWEQACAGHPDAALLQQLRNNFGPRWLTAYRPGDTKVGRLERYPVAGAAKPSYHVVDADGVRLVDAHYPNKTEARRAAQRYKITLLENEDER